MNPISRVTVPLVCLSLLSLPLQAQPEQAEPSNQASPRVLEPAHRTLTVLDADKDKEGEKQGSVDSKLEMKEHSDLLKTKTLDDLDLSDEGDHSKHASSVSCGDSIPRVGAIGVWPQATNAFGTCPSRLAAEAFLLQMIPPLTKSLWCDDVDQFKARERVAANGRLALLKQSDEALNQKALGGAASKAKAAPAEGLAGLLQWSYPLKSRDTKTLPTVTMPSLSTTKEAALVWDEREAKTCSRWGAYSAELWPTVSVFAVGKATFSGQQCPAMLIEIVPQTGRYAGSRNYMVVGLESCAGRTPPLKKPFASAFSTPEGASNWLNQLLIDTHWVGPAPRSVRPMPLGTQSEAKTIVTLAAPSKTLKKP